MNRRDCLKTFVTLAATGALPVSVATATPEQLWPDPFWATQFPLFHNGRWLVVWLSKPADANGYYMFRVSDGEEVTFGVDNVPIQELIPVIEKLVEWNYESA